MVFREGIGFFAGVNGGFYSDWLCFPVYSLLVFE